MMPKLLAETDALFFGANDLPLAATQQVLDDCLRGKDDGELFLEYRQSESLVWDDGKLKNASFNTTQGFGLRAIMGELAAYAHAGALTLPALREAASAVQVASGSGGVAMPMPVPLQRAPLYMAQSPLTSQDFASKVALLQRIDAFARSLDPRVRQVSVSLVGQWQAVQILRQGGWRVADIRPLVRLNISVVVAEGDLREAGSDGAGARTDYASLFAESHWQAQAKEALRQALVNLRAKPAKAGETTVVLGPGWPAVLLHEAIGHGLEGDFNRRQTSAFAGLLGQQIAAKGMTVVDDGTLPNRRGSLNIDDEGTPTQCTTLIEDGRLVNFIQDRLNARLMGVAPTGNGRREAYDYAPMPRMTNTVMLSGDATPAEIIASVKNGIYAKNFGGGQVDISSGKFVFSASEAYEIVDGKIGEPIKGSTLIGTGFEALKKITMIGNDSALDPGVGTCGKDGQSVPVGVGQPTMRLEEMTVGGTAV